MNISNEGAGVLKTNGDFNCCCFIERRVFEIDGKPIMTILNCILTVPTILTATMGNLLVLISFWRTPSLHTPSNVLVASLALTDLGVGLIAAPLFLVGWIAKIKGDADLFCLIIPAAIFFSFSFCVISLSTITSISLERYIALRVHLRYHEIVTVKRVCTIVVVIWILGLVYGGLHMSTRNIVTHVPAIIIPVSFFVTTFAYCAIYRVVRRHQTQINAQQLQVQQHEANSLNMAQYKKSFVNMILIYFAFLVCYFPFLVLQAVSYEPAPSQSTIDLAGTLVFMNSTVNPIVYCWRFQNIRAAVKETTRKLLWKST